MQSQTVVNKKKNNFDFNQKHTSAHVELASLIENSSNIFTKTKKGLKKKHL